MIQKYLQENTRFQLQQIKELVEIFGLETRNKYSLKLDNGEPFGYAAEQGKGLLGLLFRQFFGHWRPFHLHLFDQQKNLSYTAYHPFRFFFQRLEVTNAVDGRKIGVIQQRFGIIHKKFDILSSEGILLMRMQAPVWKLWTFPIFKGEYQVALILKKWSGVMKEVFTDADSFTLEFKSQKLTLAEKELLLFASLFIDIIYFENKASQS